MALLIASDLHIDIAGQPLLRGVSFKLERRERMTIAGRNGAGKTTLLRALAGETTIDRGELSVARGVRIALHDQRPPRERGLPLREYVLSGCTEELQIEYELAELEARMATGGAEEATLDRYARAQAQLEMRGGYLWRDRAIAMAHGLGFVDADLERALNTFSGGQLTRASLARALATSADVLLLDEPTNHLDIESLEWLEQTLVSLDAAVVLVAHDRWFLEAVGTSVLELEAGRARYFAGPWHAWRREQAAREIALGKAIDRQQAEIARMERFIERFRYKATKARQAQSRVKKLAKIERIERDPRDGQGLEFAFKPPARSGRVVFELTDALIDVGEPPLTLIEHAELWLERGEHVSLVGPNGSGKTTLIEILAGRRPLAQGRLSIGHNVTVGYLSQHADELGAGGPPGQSVLDAAGRATGLTPNKARALLGRFLFSGEEAEKPLEGLSGGERRRLSLAVLVHCGANALILDEPTNHLDIESREALEDALRAFTGAILLVSHDRALLDAVGTRTIAVEEQSLRSYVGGWPEYVRVREERRGELGRPTPHAASAPGPHAALAGSETGTTSSSTENGSKRRAKPKPAGPSKNRLSAQAAAERAIEDAEAALRAVEDELADPAVWATKYESAKSEARHTAARRAVEDAYARLEALVE
ncbi:MAG TPA: ABC-F family ATP-binding cassette domain-containing protein [Stellaceae bacterium]|jgi:ATP-binding cassette subfamily F protein 3|nr:ABC-F family ATP-binding cassette domain-containing protein [Stellaceae bacterium]